MKNILSIAVLSIFLIATSCTPKLSFNNVKSSSKCSTKDGYWYKDKCWKDFKEDNGISKKDIDSVTSAEMDIIKKSKFTLDNKEYRLISFLPLEEEDGVLIIAVYGTKDNLKTLLFPTGKKMDDLENGNTFESKAILMNGDAFSGTLDKESKLEGKSTVHIIDTDNADIEIKGEITNKNNEVQKFSFRGSKAILGGGNSNLEIKGEEAYLSGNLGTITYIQIKDLIKNNPNVKTIVMTNISGSVNDAVNMHTGRLLHENGFTTKVLSNSDIASGGVDLFCAGVERIVEKGAKIGVHSWCCFNNITADKLPKDHPAHKYQLEYFNMVLGKDYGPKFYFYTLSASPFDGIHYMSDDEIKKWHLATNFIE